jgi:hypothetical protein
MMIHVPDELLRELGLDPECWDECQEEVVSILEDVAEEESEDF